MANSSSMVLSLDACTGQLSTVSATAVAGIAPAYFAWPGSQQGAWQQPGFVVATNHGGGGPGTGATLALWLLGGSLAEPAPVDGADSFALVPDPDYVAISPGAGYALTAAYDNDSVTVTKLVYGAGPGEVGLGSSTSLGQEDVGRAPHEVKFDPSQRFVFVPCLGSDWIRMFVWDEQGGELVPNPAPDTDNNTAALPPAAAGPRHLAFHPNLSTVAYSVNELSSTVVRWDFDPDNGWLSADFEAEPQRIVSTLPPGTPAGCPIRQAGTGCAVQAAAELAVPADGRFLYASNRGQQGGVNNVATFAVDPSDGSLTPVAWEDGGGAVQFPRMISLSAGDGYLLVANQDGDSISAFRRDPDTGLLQLTDTISTAGVVTNPTFVQVVPVGQAPAACSR